MIEEIALSFHVATPARERLGVLIRPEILRRVRAGELSTDALCWCKGMPEWKPLSEVFAREELGLPSAPVCAPPPLPATPVREVLPPAHAPVPTPPAAAPPRPAVKGEAPAPAQRRPRTMSLELAYFCGVIGLIVVVGVIYAVTSRSNSKATHPVSVVETRPPAPTLPASAAPPAPEVPSVVMPPPAPLAMSPKAANPSTLAELEKTGPPGPELPRWSVSLDTNGLLSEAPAFRPPARPPANRMNFQEDAGPDLAESARPPKATAAEDQPAALSQPIVRDDSAEGEARKPELTVQQLRKAAESGDAAAQYALGQKLLQGDGLTRDHTEAVKWLRTAAEQGHSGAQVDFARMLQSGILVPEDKAAAVGWLKKAAAQDDTEAMVLLAGIYTVGDGAPIDHDECFKWFEKAARLGHAKAKYFTSLHYSNGIIAKKDLVAGMTLMREAAEGGYADAQYEHGSMLVKNYAAKSEQNRHGVDLLQKAAAQRHMAANLMMGLIYHKGTSMPQDYTQAMHHFRQAALAGEAGSFAHIGELYATGKGNVKDPAEALAYFIASMEMATKLNVSLAPRVQSLREEVEESLTRAQRVQAQSRARQILAEFAAEAEALGIPPARKREKPALTDETEEESPPAPEIAVAPPAESSAKGPVPGKNPAAIRAAAQAGDAEAQWALARMLEKGNGLTINTSEAVKWYEKAAHRDHAEAQLRMGLLLDVGELAPRDLQAGTAWLKKSAGNENTTAMILLAGNYRTGKGVAKDEEASFTWYLRAAERGSPDGQFFTAMNYEMGTGVRKDAAQSMIWLRKAAKGDCAPAQYRLASRLMNGNELSSKPYQEGRSWLEKSADQNYAQACLGFGINCMSKRYRDLAKARHHLRRAAVLGELSACGYLGILELPGEYAEGDAIEAQAYFTLNKGATEKMMAVHKEHAATLSRAQITRAEARAQQILSGFKDELRQITPATPLTRDPSMLASLRAEELADLRARAESGDPEARRRLGLALIHGLGLTKDPVEGRKWLEAAGDQGNAEAQLDLATCLDFGIGMPQDPAAATTWYRKAALRNNAQAMLMFASRYGMGQGGLQEDPDEAFRWTLKAAELDLPKAKYMLGMHYRDGKGAAKSQASAERWLREAAEDGDLPAHMELARQLTRPEDGTEERYEEANRWYRKAAEQKTADAMLELGTSYALGRGVKKDRQQALHWLRRAVLEQDKRACTLIGVIHFGDIGGQADAVEGLAWMLLGTESEGGHGAQVKDKYMKQMTKAQIKIAFDRSHEILQELADETKSQMGERK